MPRFPEESTCAEDTRAPSSLQPSLRHQNTHKSYQFNQCSRLKKHSANRCVRIHSEDREILASSTRSHERRQAPGPSVNFKEETNINGDLRNESQKTSSYALTSFRLRERFGGQGGRQASGSPAIARKSAGGNASNLRLRTEIIRLV